MFLSIETRHADSDLFRIFIKIYERDKIMESIIAKIVEQRKKDIKERGFNFGFNIPEKRIRPINKFMAEHGVILEVKRASPSKGDIAPNLNPVETALKYKANGAKAISCLTEENYFKGNLQDLMDICNAISDIAVLRKDFLIDEQEIEIAFRCGADAVLLISGILPLEKMLSMTKKCRDLGIRAFVEVRTEEDVRKVLEVKKFYKDTIVCGVNSRNLKDFSIDLLVPAMLKDELGGDVIFESGITTSQAAKKVSSMGFSGILLGEFAARNPEKAGDFVKAFESGHENACGKKLIELAKVVNRGSRRFSLSKSSVVSKKEIPNHTNDVSRVRAVRLRNDNATANCHAELVSASTNNSFRIKFGMTAPLVKICGLTRAQDVLLSDSLGADFVGFIFASGFGRNVCGEKFEEIKKILPKVHALKVAVVTDANSSEAHEAAKLAQDGTLDFIQLHGINYENVPDFLQDVPHYFAITEKNGNLKEQAEKLNSFGEPRFLQDSKNHTYGTNEHLWIAGGLNAENIHETIEKFQPELVDASSGIEDEGKIGIKNEAKMRKFFEELGTFMVHAE